MPRDPIPTWYFVIVVVRLGRRFLLVHESKHGQFWYLPAGRVEPSESFVGAAQRETLEEAGIPIVVEGVLRVEHAPALDGTACLRIIVLARPQGDTPPKNYPDEESLGAAWVTLEDLDTLPLRGDEVRQVFHYIAYGGPVYPLNLITFEGAPFVC